MAVGRTLAGRQKHRRAGKQADWQAGGQMSMQVLLMLIAVQSFSESDATWGQRTVLRLAARMGGGVVDSVVRGWGGEEDGVGMGEKRRGDHAHRRGSSVKLQLLMQERRKSLLLSSQQTRITSQLWYKKKDRGIFGSPIEPRQFTLVTRPPPGLLSCSDYSCQSPCSNHVFEHKT